MRKAWNNPKVIFTALQVCGVMALSPMLLALEGMASGGVLTVLQFSLGAFFWGWMWVSFLRMCGRLKREPSAFTERNARTLRTIAACCGALGLCMLVEPVATARMPVRGLLLGGWMGSVATVAIFFGVAAVALVLRALLISAMALQRDNDLTI